MRGQANTNRHVADRILQNQVPPYDPRNQLAHSCVGIGIGTSRDWNHRSQFGITNASERTDYRHKDKGKCNRWSGTWAAECRGVMHQIFQKRCIQDGLRFERLASNSSAYNREDARADHSSDAQGRQAPRAETLFQSMLRIFGIRNELVDGLAGK